MQSREGDVRSIMVTDVVTVLPSTSVIEVSRLMLEKNVRCILVCDDDRNLMGLVTDSDLVFATAGKVEQALRAPISDIMTQNPIAVNQDVDIYDIVAIMSDRGFRRVPVVNNGRVVGIVSVSDIVRNILQNLKD